MLLFSFSLVITVLFLKKSMHFHFSNRIFFFVFQLRKMAAIILTDLDMLFSAINLLMSLDF